MLNVLTFITTLCCYLRQILVLREYSLKYLEVKGHSIHNFSLNVLKYYVWTCVFTNIYAVVCMGKEWANDETFGIKFYNAPG